MGCWKSSVLASGSCCRVTALEMFTGDEGFFPGSVDFTAPLLGEAKTMPLFPASQSLFC